AEWAARGEDVILVRRETNPDDLPGMIAAKGILTERGGKTSHAAVVARGMGKTCVSGAEQIHVDLKTRQFTGPNGEVVKEGDVIGLCRTEHMFLGERRKNVERLILANGEEEQKAALAELLPLQRTDFIGIFDAMDGLPVTVRLIDPPLHEFLPDITELTVKI